MSVEPQKPQDPPSTSFIATAPALESLALLDRGLGAREPFVLVTGEPGVGKTTLVREALRRWGARVHARALAPTEATAETLFATLLGRFGGTANSHASGAALAQRLVEAIAHAASAGKVVMVVVEDAHTAAPAVLLQLASLAEMARGKQCAFEVLLVGAPELSARFNDPALAGLAEKVSAQVKLSQLTQHDTRHYLLQRSGAVGAAGSGMFSRKASRDIHGATFGVPRAIDVLAEEAARRAARAGATTISPEHVRSAAQALRARRSNPDATAHPPRPERTNAAAPRPANGKPGASGANGTNVAAGGAEPAKRGAGAAAPVAATPERPAAPAAAAAPPGTTAAPATASGEVKYPDSSDQRVKDWVSRFGGSGVRIGVGHAIPRYEASATLDVPARSPARGAAAASSVASHETPKRILIVDEEPPIPPELVARLAKLSRQKRRRGPNTMIQGAALAVSVGLLVVVLARQAGFGKHLAIDSADTSAHPVSAAAPAPPPLELRTGEEAARGPVRRSSAPGAGSHTERRQPKLVLTPTEPTEVAKPAPAATPKPKPALRKPVASTHVPSESLPPIPYQAASGAPAHTTAPSSVPSSGDETPVNPHQKFAIIAGSFQSNDMAKAEKDHLARLTTYRVWVNKSKVQGKRTYLLMVGRFDTMERAWDAGQSLMRRGLIRDANVSPLPE